jgi:hypothetical protein
MVEKLWDLAPVRESMKVQSRTDETRAVAQAIIDEARRRRQSP